MVRAAGRPWKGGLWWLSLCCFIKRKGKLREVICLEVTGPHILRSWPGRRCHRPSPSGWERCNHDLPGSFPVLLSLSSAARESLSLPLSTLLPLLTSHSDLLCAGGVVPASHFTPHAPREGGLLSPIVQMRKPRPRAFEVSTPRLCLQKFAVSATNLYCKWGEDKSPPSVGH